MSLLDRIERAGNALPDPATLFVLGAFLVMALSHVAVLADWEVTKTVSEGGQLVEVPVRAKSLLTADGAYWAISSLVDNFKNFPPLAIVLVGMLGIGLADRTGFISALLKATLLAVPPAWLTPTVFLVGVLSSMALDAGYVVLPPIAATLYAAVGRSPLVGIAAVFAGVAAGFSANLAVTSLDTILAGFSEAGARILDADYVVSATANYWFMVASTVLLTGVGWAVTAWQVEPRFQDKPAEEGGPVQEVDATEHTLDPVERRGLRFGAAAAGIALALAALATWIPGGPLHGMDGRFPRWVAAIVPLIFLCLPLAGPGLWVPHTRSLKNDRDVASMLGEVMSGHGSVHRAGLLRGPVRGLLPLLRARAR